MNRHQFKLYFNFHKSTLFLNWAISFSISILYFSLEKFAISTFTAGFLIALLKKEFSRKNEYYFYYNFGITKMKLRLTNFILNLLFALILILISKSW
jgi:hypothetical protein